MSTFNFNKIYVIESLDSNKEKQTGKELYNDLLRWKEQEHNGKLQAELIQIENKKEFFKCLTSIADDCEKTNLMPILHIEIHGNTEGLSLISGEFVYWSELCDNLSHINSIIGNHLFMTLAVCNGAYLMSQIKLAKPAPFFGFIGSFDSLKAEDIMIRYSEFYKEFFTSFNFSQAIQNLFNANPTVPADYKFISSEETFNEVYGNYLRDNCSKEGVKKRIEQVIGDEKMEFPSRQAKRKFGRTFEKLLLQTKDSYKKEHMSIFFMLKDFPENYKRFNLGK